MNGQSPVCGGQGGKSVILECVWLCCAGIKKPCKTDTHACVRVGEVGLQAQGLLAALCVNYRQTRLQCRPPLGPVDIK